MAQRVDGLIPVGYALAVDPIRRTVGLNLQHWLDDHGLTQTQLARRLGVNAASVNKTIRQTKPPRLHRVVRYALPLVELDPTQRLGPLVLQLIEGVEHAEYDALRTVVSDISDTTRGDTTDQHLRPLHISATVPSAFPSDNRTREADLHGGSRRLFDGGVPADFDKAFQRALDRLAIVTAELAARVADLTPAAAPEQTAGARPRPSRDADRDRGHGGPRARKSRKRS